MVLMAVFVVVPLGAGARRACPPPSHGASTSASWAAGSSSCCPPCWAAPRARERAVVLARDRGARPRAWPRSPRAWTPRRASSRRSSSSSRAFNVLEAKLPALVSRAAPGGRPRRGHRRLLERAVPRHVRRRRRWAASLAQHARLRGRHRRLRRRHRRVARGGLENGRIRPISLEDETEGLVDARSSAPVPRTQAREKTHGIGEQGDPHRQPRARSRNALHARRRRGHQHLRRHHGDVEGQAAARSRRRPSGTAWPSSASSPRSPAST